MADTFTAQMTLSPAGFWRVYVVLFGASEWPEHTWGRSAPIPTVVERAEALASLGYEVASGTEWEWIEYSELPDDPGSTVCLLAAVSVLASPSATAFVPEVGA